MLLDKTVEFILLNGHVSAVFKISLIKFLYSKKIAVTVFAFSDSRKV